MKTPRLALFAFLALALAPRANAGDLPRWTVADESFRAWPSVYFKVGNTGHTLRCRLSECDPEKKKGVSNLYVMKQKGGTEPIKATIYKLVPRSKLNPRYYTDGPYDKVPEVIDSHRTRYETLLSNFKLDNTGASLVVVQGTQKYPATTDIRQAYFSASGSVIAVAPPTAVADDAVKPDARPGNGPATRPGNGGTAAKWWCDPATGTKYSAARGRRGSVLLPSENAQCRKTGGTTAPPVVTPPDGSVAEGGLPLSDAELIWLDKSQAHLYKTKMPAPPASLSVIKAHIDANRAFIVENLDPNAAAISKYKAAAADPKATPAAIDAALPPEVWGGKDNKTIVGLFGDRADVQLSKAEYDALAKLPAAAAGGETPAQAYARARAFASGEGKGPGYFADSYDPIVLHRTVMAARKGLPQAPATGPVVEPKPEDGTALVAPLTAEELKLLTPKEKRAYEKLLDNVKKKVPGAEKALSDESDRLRKLIVAEKREPKPAYAAPKNIEEFKKLPNWHKDIFCDPKVAGEASMNAGPAPSATELNKGKALPTLNKVNAELKAEQIASDQKSATDAAASLPDWAKEPCALYLAGKTPTTPANGNGNNGNAGSGAGGIAGNITNGPDAVGKEKEGNKWLTKPLITTGIKGGLIGLLIGSLFGPVGLIAGPLIGAAIFYGMQKYNEIKEEKAKNKPE